MTAADDVILRAKLELREAMKLKPGDPTPVLVSRRTMGILIGKSRSWFDQKASKGEMFGSVKVGGERQFDWAKMLRQAMDGEII